MSVTLDFERSIRDLESKLAELHHMAQVDEMDISGEVKRLQEKTEKLLEKTYKNLTPWQKVLPVKSV